MIAISERRLARYQAAEEVARAARAFLSMRVCDQTEAHGAAMCKAIRAWMDKAPGKQKYRSPKNWPVAQEAAR